MDTSSNLISSPAEDRATGQGVTVWSQMIPSVQGSVAFLLKGAVAGLPGVCGDSHSSCGSLLFCPRCCRKSEGVPGSVSFRPHAVSSIGNIPEGQTNELQAGVILFFPVFFFFFKSHELVLYAGSV